MPNAVECHHLSKNFGALCAVQDLSLSLPQGQIMALLGPSGCGKTTSLRMIAGLETPDSGAIILNGREVFSPTHNSPPNQRQIGMVFQEYALFPHLNVAQNIGYGLPRNPQRPARIAEMLALVGLSGLGKRYPQQLSGGQQQRVALARALAPKPHTLLLDEPFSNLDAGLRAQVREEVQRIIREAGVSAILVTHDQAEALSVADLVGVMLDGQLVQIANPRQLYAAPISKAVALFLGDVNLLHGQADGLSAQTALGKLPIQQALQGRADVLIRYTDLNASKTPNPDASSAQVVSVGYHGNRQTLRVALDDGSELVLDVEPHETFAIGEIVTLSLRGSALAFPVD